MTLIGTKPYFSARSATPQKVPPSDTGCLKKNCTRGSSIGLLAQSMTACNMRLDFSNWSQKKDRKSTRLNSSHANISYAVFCLKKNNDRHIKGLIFSSFTVSSSLFFLL